MKRRPLILASVAVGLALVVSFQASPASAQSAAAPKRSMRVLHDLQYYTGPDADKQLHAFDLFLPEGKTRVPMLFFVHGGGWRVGDKVYPGLDHIVNMSIDMGMGVMSVNYRLSPAVKHPTHIQDVARAFAWLYENGASYGADRDRIFIAGGSAGAHLVALLGIDPRYLKAHGIPPTAIKGVMPFSGVYDMPNWYTLGSAGGVASQTAAQSNSSVGVLYDMIKVAFGTDYELLRGASPATYVGQLGKDTPPYLISYTDDDMYGMAEQAVNFYGLFVRHRLRAELVQQPGRLHSTKTSGIGQQERGADDVLGMAIKRFIQSVNDRTFGEAMTAVWPADGATAPALRTIKDQRYDTGPGSDPKFHSLDLFLPQGKENVPLVFYVHGGGWRAGDKGDPATLYNLFGRLGVGMVSVNYRLSPQSQHPAHIQDVARAFGWVYKNAAQYQIDRNRIVILGSSAGAHLVALLGLNTEYLANEGVVPDAIKGVVALSGIYDLESWPEPGKVPTRKEQAFGTNPAVLRQASPVTYASPKAPPFLVTYTDWDLFMLKEQAIELYDVLLKQGTSVELVGVPGRTHVGTAEIGRFANQVEDVLGPAIARFVAERIGKARPAAARSGGAAR